MRVLAPAKINLFLSVGPRREDGYHDLESVMQSVSLYDSLTIETSETFAFTVTPDGAAPEDETNLVVRAARALWSSIGRSPGADVSLAKEIPVEAGLAGGSADAAAALVGLSDLWELGVSRKALEKMGAALGADVPFCVRGGTAVARGIGTTLSPLGVGSPVWWVVAVPDGSLATAAVYEAFDEQGGSRATEDPFEVADALARADLDRLGASLRNDLEDAAATLLPAVASMRPLLLGAGAVAAVMSGSGPSWCGLCRDESHARRVAAAVSERIRRVFVVSSLDRGPRIVER